MSNGFTSRFDSFGHRKPSLLLVISVCIVAQCMPSSGEPIGTFRAEGSLIYSVFSQTGAIQQERRVHFTATVSNRLWNIVTEMRDTAYIEEAGFDGTNVFKVFRSIGTPGSTNRLHPSSNISRSDHPDWMAPFGKIVWLAFASGDYLSRSTNIGIPPPWLGEGFGLRKYDVKGWLGGSNLPSNVDFWYGKGSATNKELFLEAHYSVLQTTNLFGDVSWPLQFELRRKWRSARGSAGSKATGLYNLFVGQVTNVAALQRTQFLPTLGGKVFVDDSRYYDPTRAQMTKRHVVCGVKHRVLQLKTAAQRVKYAVPEDVRSQLRIITCVSTLLEFVTAFSDNVAQQ